MMKQQLSNDLIREDLHDGRVVVFTLSSMKRDMVDIWIDECLVLMQDCHEKGQEVRVIQDLSHPDVAVTPYSRKRSEDVAEAYPDLAERTSIVMPPTITKHQLEIFIRKEQVGAGFRERRGFTSREAALAWLEESLD